MTAPEFSDGDEPTVVIDAPWGLKADGTPKAKPGARPGPRSAAGPRKAAAPGPRRPAASKAAGKGRGVDYRAALLGLGHLPIGIVSMGARLIRNDRKRSAVQLDALAAKVHLPGIAEAVNNAAQTNSKIAAALDRVVQVGPYGELIAAVSPLVLQCMANHGMIDANPQMGLMGAEDLVKAATA